MGLNPKFKMTQSVRTRHELGFSKFTSTISEIQVLEETGWIGYRLKDDPLRAWLKEEYLTSVEEVAASEDTPAPTTAIQPTPEADYADCWTPEQLQRLFNVLDQKRQQAHTDQRRESLEIQCGVVAKLHSAAMSGRINELIEEALN